MLQITLLDEGKSVPEELKLKSIQLLNATSVSRSVSVDETFAQSDAEILQEKVSC